MTPIWSKARHFHALLMFNVAEGAAHCLPILPYDCGDITCFYTAQALLDLK